MVSKLRNILKAKTEGKATSADTAGSEGVDDGGIMFFNAEENNTGSGTLRINPSPFYVH